MNGLKRASRRQAAVFGLAVLMGTSFLGCHSGPKLFSRKDRDDRAAKKELAEKQKGTSKFIDRKKVRPESDYLDDDDEQIAKSSRIAGNRSAEVTRKPSTDVAKRSSATRQQSVDSSSSSTRTSQATANQSKSLSSKDSASIASQESSKNKRSIDDFLTNDSLFDDDRPVDRSASNKTASKNTIVRSRAARPISLDEDPFRDSVIGPRSNKSDEKKVATVNFFEDDEHDDDDRDDESEDFDELTLPTPSKSVASANRSIRQSNTWATQNKQKFLDDLDEPANGSFRSLIREGNSEIAVDEIVDRTAAKTTERFKDNVNSTAKNKQLDRRQQIDDTLHDWRRELGAEESLPKLNQTTNVSERPSTSRTDTAPTARGHISQVSIDEFNPPEKSQGAILNGELIIDTSTLPSSSRFQRTSENAPMPSHTKGSDARANPNAGVDIDIIPGAPQTRTRSAGQISLQSASDELTTTRLTTADFEQSNAPNPPEQFPKLKLDTESLPGLKLTPIDNEPNLTPKPTEEKANVASTQVSSPFRLGVGTMLLAIGAMASAVLIGLGLRRRMELKPAPQPIRVPKTTSEHCDVPN